MVRRTRSAAQLEPGAHERVEARREAAGRAALGQIGDSNSKLGFDDSGHVLDGPVQLGDDLGRGPLLGGEDRGAHRSAKGHVDVAGHGDGGLPEAGIHPAEVDLRQVDERGAALPQLVAALVEEARAEGRGGPGADVHGGTAPQAHEDAAVAGVEGRDDELARAIGRRHPRVSLLHRQETDTGRAGHLDDGRLAVAEDSPTGPHRLQPGPEHVRLEKLAVGGRDENVEGVVAAVGNGHGDRLGVGGYGQHAFDHGLGGVVGAQAALESLGHAEDSHKGRARRPSPRGAAARGGVTGEAPCPGLRRSDR